MVDWTNNWQSEKFRGHVCRSQQLGLFPPLVLPNWSWPAPHFADLNNTAHVLLWQAEKSFASLLAVADLDAGFTSNVHPASHTPIDQQQTIVKLFQRSMNQAWTEGWKIIFGTEEFDRLTRPKHTNTTHIMDTIFTILPWNVPTKSVNDPSIFRKNYPKPYNVSDRRTFCQRPARFDKNRTIHHQNMTLQIEDIEVVVMYRSPRIHQVRSLWHEVGGINQTFSQFLQGRFGNTAHHHFHGFGQHIHVLETLPLAYSFLQRHVRTTIIDISGLPNTTTNLCHIVACDILRDVDCTDEPRVRSLSGYSTYNVTSRVGDISTKKFNIRIDDEKGGVMDLTPQQWNDIEEIFQEYDCSWKHTLLSSPLFRILYQQDLFATCGDIDTDFVAAATGGRGKSLSWLIQKIEEAI
jgi:hypothetical protein